MALNIKLLMSREHPEVSYPKKELKASASFAKDEFELKKDHLEEKAFEEEAKRYCKNIMDRLLNVIR